MSWPLWALCKWCKTMQSSQRSAGGDSGSIGSQPETCTEWIWNDSTSPISLGCQGCYREVGASDQAIHAFKHSLTGILCQQPMLSYSSPSLHSDCLHTACCTTVFYSLR